MIEHTKIPGFRFVGEVGVYTHIYQFIETPKTPKFLNATVIVRAVDVEPTFWVGMIIQQFSLVVNSLSDKIDLTNVRGFYPNIKRVKSFKSFIKGHEFDSFYDEFQEIDEVDFDEELLKTRQGNVC